MKHFITQKPKPVGQINEKMKYIRNGLQMLVMTMTSKLQNKIPLDLIMK